MDKLDALYHTSPKRQRELHFWAEDLAIIFLTIVRVLGIRWVASSDRTVKAVWLLYRALHAHINAAAADQSRDSKENSKYRGLLEQLTATAFVTETPG
ncbi:hypothetical protein EOD39_8789 [Acipenser ruthenus]|uniref:Uncharacterized protein n=1 Tax=Acipenser ruthenus TaxID=7906 RepID=A0A662YVZ2_ACIRT|nr:hypothetical protein EOD39_8789 [Acipenser ruthenus]